MNMKMWESVRGSEKMREARKVKWGVLDHTCNSSTGLSFGLLVPARSHQRFATGTFVTSGQFCCRSEKGVPLEAGFSEDKRCIRAIHDSVQ